jgi:tryptophan synthase alpha chain
VDQITAAFAQARAQKRAALIPYFTLGFPTPEISLDIVTAIAEAGADLIELGIPFSDPLADGPTIQHSTQVALQNGVTPAQCLEMAAALRRRGVAQPLLFMGYINPMLAYGLADFVKQAAASGISGLIVPDLPPEEATELENLCSLQGISLVYLAAPNTTTNRLQLLARRTSGFLYLVSLTGVTGARSGLPVGLEEFTMRARQIAQTPIAVGFGISTPEQAEAVGLLADGVIVGSALIRAVSNSDNPPYAAAEFVSSLLKGLSKLPHG